MRFRMDQATLFLLKAFDMNQFKERLGNLIESLIRSQNQTPLAINRTRPDVDPHYALSFYSLYMSSLVSSQDLEHSH